MKRRACIATAGLAWLPGMTGAQTQTQTPAPAPTTGAKWRIGVLVTGTLASLATQETVGALQAGLEAQGLSRGRDFEFDVRAADGDIARLPSLVRELQASRPAVVVGGGNQILAELARQPTQVPVVGVGNLVGAGLAASLQSPGGRATGMTTFGVDLNGKRLEIMLDALPKGAGVVLLAEDWAREHIVPELQAWAVARGSQATAAYLRTPDQVAGAIAQARRAGMAGVVVLESPLLSQWTAAIVAAAKTHRLPTMQAWPDHVREGAVMGYGPWRRSVWEQLAAPLAKVLRGTPAGEIPIDRVTRVVLAVNRAAAHQVGLKLPLALLARADEVVE